MDKKEKDKLISSAQAWFREEILPNHIRNTKKLTAAEEFDINPFLVFYLAGYLTGEINSHSVALALLYPRVLGTSITTSFGQNMQKFISEVLKGYGSLVPGVDIEFIDAIDGRKKYCQAKLGPNTINKDDIATIHAHFKAARNLSRTNNVAVQQGDLVIGILYGEPGQESNHYKKLSSDHEYPLFIGKEFWHRLTGDANFYKKLIKAIADVAVEAKGSEIIKDVAETLSKSDVIKKMLDPE